MINARPDEHCDFLIIGGGFYGCNLALTLHRQHAGKKIILVEQESAILTRASYCNQARVHNGYHYPRSLITAARSRANYQQFLKDYADCIDDNFIKIYAIARRGSQVTARQFIRFCREIGADLRPVRVDLRRHFTSQLIDDCFETDEVAFNAVALRRKLQEKLDATTIDLRLGHRVHAMRMNANTQQNLVTVVARGQETSIAADQVFNCTYAGLNHIGAADDPSLKRSLKYELTEIALIEVPEPLLHVGITVMDGPFFSTMPFPSRGLHSLSHVRYTPHFSWTAAEAPGQRPDDIRDRYPKLSRAASMLRDAQRYVPLLRDAVIRDALFDVKVVLKRNEGDDGRPILMAAHPGQPGLTSVLGGKIDNIFDIMALLDPGGNHASF